MRIDIESHWPKVFTIQGFTRPNRKGPHMCFICAYKYNYSCVWSVYQRETWESEERRRHGVNAIVPGVWGLYGRDHVFNTDMFMPIVTVIMVLIEKDGWLNITRWILRSTNGWACWDVCKECELRNYNSKQEISTLQTDEINPFPSMLRNEKMSLPRLRSMYDAALELYILLMLGFPVSCLNAEIWIAWKASNFNIAKYGWLSNNGRKWMVSYR